MSAYRAEIMRATDCTAEEAPLVECWMRLEHPTLDGIDARTFKREAMLGLYLTRSEPERSRDLARSYGERV